MELSKITMSVAALAMLAWGSAAGAATCTATSTLTNPDATLTNSTLCGPGIVNDQNDSEADIATVFGSGTWTLLDKDDPTVGGSSTSGTLRTTGFPGSAGSWAFNDAGYTNYIIVIKDGGSPGGNEPQSIYWAWFVVDTSAGCDAGSALNGFSYCGTWSMYGDAGKIKNISHMTLYGSNRRPPDKVPEPGTLALLGLGLLGLGAARRRKA